MISSPTTRIDQLPMELTSFVGRYGDVERLCGLLATSRLVTIVGPGGVGKTRLAMRVLDSCSSVTRSAIRVVDVADHGKLAELTQAAALSSNAELIVLDTCEYAAEACAAWVLALLAAAPEARVLAVSRVPLGVHGEQLWRLDPLGVPPPEARFQELDSFPAVELLVDRVAMRQPGFDLNVHNAAPIAQLCRRTSGLPLALEHAAEQVALLGLDIVAHQYPSSELLGMPTAAICPDRQRSVRADFEWGRGLLSPDEQRLLARLGVFADGFTIDAAEYACRAPEGDRASVLESLQRLVNASVVQFEREPAPYGRYRLLNTTRVLATEMLSASELRQMQDRVMEWLQVLADGIEPSTTDVAALQSLAEEAGNLRAMFAAAAGADSDPEQRARALRLCVSCFPLWRLLQPEQGAEWLGRLRVADGLLMDPVLSARVSWMSGMFAVYAGHAQQAIVDLRAALPTLEHRGDDFGALEARYFLGEAYRLAGDLGAARQEFTELWRTTSARQQLLASGIQARLALVLLESGEVAVARRHAQEALRNAALNLHDWSLTRAWELVGKLALHDGHPETAADAFTEAISYARGCREPGAWIAPSFELAAVYVQLGDRGRAAGVLLDLLETTAGSNALTLAHFRWLAALLARLLEPQRPERATWFREAANRLSSSEAIGPRSVEIVMLTADAESTLRSFVTNPHRVHKGARSLTPREVEVARLTARGLTNREIARELSLSEGTVRAHMGHILDKLGLRSRVQISAWLSQSDAEAQSSRQG